MIFFNHQTLHFRGDEEKFFLRKDFEKIFAKL